MSRTNGERTILVSGATGQQGGAVARHLLDGGFAVRALTRSPSSPGAKALEELGAEIVQGSFGDPASLARALDRVQGAYSVQTFLEEGPQGEAAQGRAFAEAAAEAGVEHFVYSSVGGAERDTGIPHFDSKWAVEQRIRELGLPATILRPVFFMDNWGAMMREPILAGQLPQPLGPDTPLQQIDVDDIGVFAAMAFENPESWIGREVELAGDGLTMTETAEAFGEALGRAVQYVQVPWDAFAAQAGEEFTVMYRWFEEAGYEADIEGLRGEHPGLTSLEAFLEEEDWLE